MKFKWHSQLPRAGMQSRSAGTSTLALCLTFSEDEGQIQKGGCTRVSCRASSPQSQLNGIS